MTPRTVVLGYKIPGGKRIDVPILHLAVTGQTQQSGKTTTLEALIQRSGLRAVAFVTKRAEASFAEARRIPAYFRERADWQFVSALLEATLRERMKFERSWIMRVCKGAHSLVDVHANVKKALETARGLNENVYMTLDEYFRLVIPQIESLPFSARLELEPGINVIDVAEYSTEVQSLVIRSVLEWVYEHERETIVIIPEAWEFVPEKRNSPVKLAVIELIRKGAAAGNYVWLDSQDIAGVDKTVLKQISVWIMGVQREANEVKRTLAHIPASSARPKLEEIMTLGRGEFFVSHGKELHRVYVQPAWMSGDDAELVARRALKAEELAGAHALKAAAAPLPEDTGPRDAAAEDEAMWKAKFEAEKARAEELQRSIESLQKEVRAQSATIARLERERTTASAAAPSGGPASIDVDALYQAFRSRLEKEPGLLRLALAKPELDVTVHRVEIDVDGDTLRGRLARLVAEHWFDEGRTGNSAYEELKRLGFSTAKPNVYKELDKLASWGFVTKEASGGFKAVAGMKIRIRETETA